MPDEFDVLVNGSRVCVKPGTTAAAALIIARAWRTSVTHEPRGPLCGMGVCFECRATVDGAPHIKTCQVLVRAGMQIDSK